MGNDYLIVDGRIIGIYNIASGKRWKYSIDNEFSKLTYDTKTNAMAAAFDQMEVMRAHE